MAKLTDNPAGVELEDFVSAHFASRGCYVETAITERHPDDILELDVVWTDYRVDPEVKRPVEVKSGDWGMGDVFKFYGWTKYLGLEPGQFIHKEPNGRVNPASLEHVRDKTGVDLWHINKLGDANAYLNGLGLPDPTSPDLPSLWRYSFWMRRRLRRSLNVAITSKLCPGSAEAAKEYLRLVNDAVFFISDVRMRIEKLLLAHFGHQELGKSAAYELETGNVEFNNPPSTRAFTKAYFHGEHFPVQACLYAAHRARLYILKALIDYWLAVQRGGMKGRDLVVRLGEKVIHLPAPDLTNAMQVGLEKLSSAKSFRLFPVFWQSFLWSWGGFLLKDRLADEYSLLEAETGVPVADIPAALSAFDEIFPIENGWFREPPGDMRRVFILMPAAMRGLGAFRRLCRIKAEKYSDLKCDQETARRMAWDNNAGARLLDCDDAELAK